MEERGYHNCGARAFYPPFKRATHGAVLMLILEELHTTTYSAPYRALLGPRSLQAHDTGFRWRKIE